ncbi:hypothetical protein BGW41_005921 [Actinomortierella wolfii]|nr:hypothetical protein BGW41_005921 [Actinomortierella wolfii]
MTRESSTSSQDQQATEQNALTPTIAHDPERPSDQFTNRLLVASGTAFLTGIFGSLWYQSRKTRQRGIHRAALAASNRNSLSSRLSSPSAGADNIPRPRLQSLNDVKTTEALIREGRLLGLKAFAIATALCVSGAVVIVGTTRWMLDVQTIPEFSAKMRDLFPKQRAKFVGAVVDADQAVFGGEKKQQGQETEGPPSASLPTSAQTATPKDHEGDRMESNQGEEVDLDHELDSNLLSRIEREIKKLAEEDP